MADNSDSEDFLEGADEETRQEARRMLHGDEDTEDTDDTETSEIFSELEDEDDDEEETNAKLAQLNVKGLSFPPQASFTVVASKPSAPVAPTSVLPTMVVRPPVVVVQPAKPTFTAAQIENNFGNLVPVSSEEQRTQVNQLKIEDLLQKETTESDSEFAIRKELTVKLARIPDLPLTNITALGLGLTIAKKKALGVSYDSNVEAAISYVLALLAR